MLSFIVWGVRGLPVIFTTGAIGLPIGVPRPEVNTTTCAPPPTMPVTDSTSRPGVSITVRPFLVIGAAYATTSTSGDRSPPLCVAPRDFSSMVVRPPRMLPGDGCVPRMSRPSAIVSASTRLTTRRRCAAVSGLDARPASTCSAPMISAISPSTAAPPRSTRRSATRPSTGFAVSPDV